MFSINYPDINKNTEIKCNSKATFVPPNHLCLHLWKFTKCGFLEIWIGLPTDPSLGSPAGKQAWEPFPLGSDLVKALRITEFRFPLGEQSECFLSAYFNALMCNFVSWNINLIRENSWTWQQYDDCAEEVGKGIEGINGDGGKVKLNKLAKVFTHMGS